MSTELGKSEVLSRQEVNTFKQIKPKEGMTTDRARTFWDNLFAKEINPKEVFEEKRDEKSSEVRASREDVPENHPQEGQGVQEGDGKTQDADEAKELTEDEINEKQRAAIKEAFERIARGEELTDAEKGNLGEMLMDQYYISIGCKPIQKPRVVDLTHKSGQGIDGVYEKTNPDGSKSFVIAEAKVNRSPLNKGLTDGTNQMSETWIEKRLDNAVGKEKADEIRDTYEDCPENISCEVYNFKIAKQEDGSSTAEVYTVDKDGKRNSDKDVVQSIDSQGDVITGGGQYDER